LYNKASNWEKIPLFWFCCIFREAGKVIITYVWKSSFLKYLLDMFTKANHEVYLPDGTNPEEVLSSSTTHLAIAAQQDDIEIMAIDEILQGLNSPDAYFSVYVVIVGHGHPV